MKEAACILVSISGQREKVDLANRFAAQASIALQRRLGGLDQKWCVSPAINMMSLYAPTRKQAVQPQGQHYTIAITGAHFTEETNAFYECVKTLKLLKKEMFALHGVIKTDNFAVHLLLCSPQPVDAARNLSVMRVDQTTEIG